ncbi:transposase [Streptomyces sp. NPDC051219]|uniref:transposase n=1 Tax=Streptomyces sp. NPDC051219 TaxID=3155283 RepID=UPI00342F244C
MLDAIRYLVAGGISWRAMPADFPDWGRVYAFFRRWREHGLINEFHDRLRGRVREREGREAEPTAGIIDAQSVKAAASVPTISRGFDGGKKINGSGIEVADLLMTMRPAGRHRSSATSYKPFLRHIASGKPERTRTIKLKNGRKHPRVLTAAQVQKILDAC